jgi:hypothetical protein
VKNPAKANIPIPEPARHRRHMAPAFLKPNINWDNEDISWMHVDKKGQTVNPKYITLRQGYTTSKARASALIH